MVTAVYEGLCSSSMIMPQRPTRMILGKVSPISGSLRVEVLTVKALSPRGPA